MAGTIIADFIRTDASQLSLNVGNTTFATINASGFFSNTGTQLIAANGKISSASLISPVPKTVMAQSSMPSNTICQIIRATDATVRTQSSNTTVQMAGSVTITPNYSNSVVIGMFNIANENNGTADLGTKFEIYRVVGGSATSVASVSYDLYDSGANSQLINRSQLQFTDSPGTTSAVTYQYAFAPSNASGSARINNYSYATNMIVMEVSP
jgi:hypothetical protein